MPVADLLSCALGDELWPLLLTWVCTICYCSLARVCTLSYSMHSALSQSVLQAACVDLMRLGWDELLQQMLLPLQAMLERSAPRMNPY